MDLSSYVIDVRTATPTVILDHITLLSEIRDELYSEAVANEMDNPLIQEVDSRIAKVISQWYARRESGEASLGEMAKITCEFGHVWFARATYWGGTRLDPPEYALQDEDNWFCPYCGREGDWA